ncbi:major facilitator superfamily domain-containing protein [Umbelopsis sp. PMI_123]|nr:major facilitator superfamily domain-containing protein [Umbelopsis sp. PMI_123]
MSSSTVAANQPYELKTYPQAWLALFLLVCLRAASAVFQYTFAPIPSVTAEYFGVSISYINWLSNVQGIVYVVLSFFTGWIFEKLGVKKSRLISFNQKFQSTWFTDNLRATAGMFLIVVAIFASVAFVPLIFMPSKPKTPPTYVQATDRPPFFEGLKMLSKNGHYWVLFVIHGINVGLSMALATIFNQVITPYGYTNAQSGQLSAVSFFAGTLGCSVAGPVLDITKQHKLFLRLMAPLTLATYVGFIFIGKLGVEGKSNFTYCPSGALIPTFITVSYPVAESTSNSLLWQGCQLFGFIFVLIMDQLRDQDGTPKDNMQKALILQAALMSVCTILAFVYNGRMRRTEAMAEELKQREQEEKDLAELKPPCFDRERTGSVCSEQSDVTRVGERDLEKQKGRAI